MISRATMKTLMEIGKAKNPKAKVWYVSWKYSNNPNKGRKERKEEWQQKQKPEVTNEKQRPTSNYISTFTKCYCNKCTNIVNTPIKGTKVCCYE